MEFKKLLGLILADPALDDDTRWNSTTPFNIGRIIMVQNTLMV